MRAHTSHNVLSNMSKYYVRMFDVGCERPSGQTYFPLLFITHPRHGPFWQKDSARNSQEGQCLVCSQKTSDSGATGFSHSSLAGGHCVLHVICCGLDCAWMPRVASFEKNTLKCCIFLGSMRRHSSMAKNCCQPPWTWWSKG